MKNIAMFLLGLGTLTLLISLFILTLTWNSIQEDSMLWNCLLMGNHQCGDVGHIAGFIVGRK